MLILVFLGKKFGKFVEGSGYFERGEVEPLVCGVLFDFGSEEMKYVRLLI